MSTPTSNVGSDIGRLTGFWFPGKTVLQGLGLAIKRELFVNGDNKIYENKCPLAIVGVIYLASMNALHSFHEFSHENIAAFILWTQQREWSRRAREIFHSNLRTTIFTCSRFGLQIRNAFCSLTIAKLHVSF